MEIPNLPIPTDSILLTHVVVASDVERSAAFYSDVPGGGTVRAGEPSIVIQTADGWISLDVGGGPTDHQPGVVLVTPDPDGHLIEVGQMKPGWG